MLLNEKEHYRNRVLFLDRRLDNMLAGESALLDRVHYLEGLNFEKQHSLDILQEQLQRKIEESNADKANVARLTQENKQQAAVHVILKQSRDELEKKEKMTAKHNEELIELNTKISDELETTNTSLNLFKNIMLGGLSRIDEKLQKKKNKLLTKCFPMRLLKLSKLEDIVTELINILDHSKT